MDGWLHDRSGRAISARWAGLLVLISTLVFALAACSGDGFSTNDSAPNMTEPGSAEQSGGLLDHADDRGTSNGGGFDVAPGGPAVGMPAPEAPPMDADAPRPGGVSSGEGQPLPSLQALGRTIIRSGSIDLVVEEVDTSYHRVQQIAAGAGGFVADSTFAGRDEEQRATLTIRVPADRFQAVVDELTEHAIEVRGISTTAQDVTEEFTDLESALRNLRAVETQYLELLRQAEDISDVLLVQDRLNGVRDQIERIEGRLRLLENLSDMATLTVSLRAEVENGSDGDGWFGGAIRDGWERSLELLERGATAVVTAAVFSWWILPLVLVAWLVIRRWQRNRPAPVDDVDTPVEAA